MRWSLFKQFLKIPLTTEWSRNIVFLNISAALKQIQSDGLFPAYFCNLSNMWLQNRLALTRTHTHSHSLSHSLSRTNRCSSIQLHTFFSKPISETNYSSENHFSKLETYSGIRDGTKRETRKSFFWIFFLHIFNWTTGLDCNCIICHSLDNRSARRFGGKLTGKDPTKTNWKFGSSWQLCEA